jgi:hypothetical protein
MLFIKKDNIMNIDLRDVSIEFQKEIEEIKKINDYKTNIKAVSHCVINHLKNIHEIEKLKNELYLSRKEISEIKGKINLGVEFFDFLNRIK